MTPEEQFIYRNSSKCPFTDRPHIACGNWCALYSIENQCGLSGLANEMDHLARSIDKLQATLSTAKGSATNPEQSP